MSQYSGIIASVGSKVMNKSNGAQYVLQSVLLTDGPAKGLTVTATRTTLTKEGAVKAIPAVDAVVILHHTMLPSTADATKKVHFFEIATGAVTASNDELTALLG